MNSLVDTNVLVRLIVGEPADQAATATQDVAEAGVGEWLVDRVVLAESLYVLRANYGFSKPESLGLLTDLLAHKAFGFVDPRVCQNMLAIMSTTVLSPEDACLAALVRAGIGGRIQTFDVALAKFAAKGHTGV